MRHITSLTSAAAIALLGLSLAAPPASAGRAPAPAPAIKCGDTITTSVVLTRNLTCAGDGLTVSGSAPGITVNLNGHRITGAGTGAGVVVGGLPDASVSIINGRISGFAVGVGNWTFGTRLSDLVVSDNGRGVESNAHGLVVERSTFRSNSMGIGHVGWAQVSGSTFRGNDTGIVCGDAELTVTSSRFVDNRRGLKADVCGVRISASDFSGGEIGAALTPVGYAVDVRDSTFRSAGIGLEVREALSPSVASRQITGNVFQNNRASGLLVKNTYAPTGTIAVSGNTFRNNGYAPGTFGDGTPQPTSGVWANVGTFSNNQARGNAGNGIEAYGVIDGGGNAARGNRTEPQCLGVVCSR